VTPLLIPADPNTVTITLPPDLLKRLEDRAAKKKQPLTDYLTHALTMYVK
jgi:predicted transcriptional regulator